MASIKTNLTVFAVLCSVIVSAQYTEVINSNRPGFSQSSFSVGKNVLQFEAGPFYIKEERTPPISNEVKGFGVDFAVRYGLLFEELEVSVIGTYQNDTFTTFTSTASEDKRSNFKNFTIGAKYLVYDPYKNAGEDKPNLYSWRANRKFKWKSLIPAVSVYTGANFDSKDNPYVPPGVEGFSPKLAIATQNNFAGGWVFVMNLVKDRIGTDFSDFQYILTLTHSFNPQWAIFGEAQGIKSDFYADNLFRVGAGYLWNKDLQLDGALTFNTKDTPAVLNISFGASYRLDFHKDPDNGDSAKDEYKRQARKRKKKRKKKGDNFDDFKDGRQL